MSIADEWASYEQAILSDRPDLDAHSREVLRHAFYGGAVAVTNMTLRQTGGLIAELKRYAASNDEGRA